MDGYFGYIGATIAAESLLPDLNRCPATAEHGLYIFGNNGITLIHKCPRLAAFSNANPALGDKPY